MAFSLLGSRWNQTEYIMTEYCWKPHCFPLTSPWKHSSAGVHLWHDGSLILFNTLRSVSKPFMFLHETNVMCRLKINSRVLLYMAHTKIQLNMAALNQSGAGYGPQNMWYEKDAKWWILYQGEHAQGEIDEHNNNKPVFVQGIKPAAFTRGASSFWLNALCLLLLLPDCISLTKLRRNRRITWRLSE